MGYLWLIGMRRSGTSFMRQVLCKAPGVDLLFEPRDLWFAVTQGHLRRFKFNPSVTGAFDRFESSGATGAKFALDPGIGAFYWKHLPLRYRGSRFVFIRRRQKPTYASYAKTDGGSVQGIVPADIHRWFWTELYGQFADFAAENPAAAVLIEYEDVLRDADTACEPLWRLLGSRPAPGVVRAMVKAPEHG